DALRLLRRARPASGRDRPLRHHGVRRRPSPHRDRDPDGLGADTRRVVAMVLGRAGRRVALGLAIGTGLCVWAPRFVAALVYGVEADDPVTLAAAAAVLAGVSALSAWLPARDAARIDPARVLREG